MPANDPKQCWRKTTMGNYRRPRGITEDHERLRKTTGNHAITRETTEAARRFGPQKLKVDLKVKPDASNGRPRETTGGPLETTEGPCRPQGPDPALRFWPPSQI